jgi:ABC-type antimicrobial peptide transport system permease subunit
MSIGGGAGNLAALGKLCTGPTVDAMQGENRFESAAYTDVRTMDDVLLRSVSRQRLHTGLLGVFGGAAVLLAAIGIYSVIAYVVESRSREIGIRVALGATPARVRRLVVGDGLRWVGVGLAIGLLNAYVLAATLSTVLYGVSPHDLFVFVGVPVTLLAVCLLSVIVPAARAGTISGGQSSLR